MRKLLLILFCLPIIGFGQKDKRIEIGILLGSSLNYLSGINIPNTYDDFEVKNKYGSTQSLVLNYHFNKFLAVNTGINYYNTGGKIEVEHKGWGALAQELEFEYNYISFPISISYSFSEKPKYIVETGLYNAFLVSDSYTFVCDTDFGAVFGFGISYPLNKKVNILVKCKAHNGIAHIDTFGSTIQTYRAVFGLTYNIKKSN